MKKKAAIIILAAKEDFDSLGGVLDQLRKKGMRISKGAGNLRKKDVVIAVLSERFYADESLKAQLFSQLAVGADLILPLKLGDAPVPEDIMNLLFSRNIIMASGRDDAQLAERILSAIPDRKSHMPAIFSAAAVVLLLLGGVYLWYSMQEPEAEPVIADVEEDPVVYPWGITEEDLAKIQDVIIIGNKFAYFTIEDMKAQMRWPVISDFAYQSWEGEDHFWYSTEDGHAYSMARYDDLRFLELMPNLSKLHMVLVDVDPQMLPDLSKSTALNEVSIYDCSFTDVNWLAGSGVTSLQICGTDIQDYSPLSQCGYLRYVTIDGYGKAKGNVSGFAPPALTELYISNLGNGQSDLSALADCSKLSSLYLDYLDITDLSFLESNKNLLCLTLNYLPQLRDISAVSSLRNLKELYIYQCDQITDYMPINSCGFLESIQIQRNNNIPVDSSFLSGLPKLINIGLFNLSLNNMDFLSSISRYNINLAFGGEIQDYSGLAAISTYQFLHLNLRSTDMVYGDYSLVSPYLEDCSINTLELYNCTNVDLSKLPKVTNELRINRGDLTSLEGLNLPYARRLELKDMQFLRSLDGIQGMEYLKKNSVALSIYGCARLTDYSALYGTKLSSLSLVGTGMIPDFSEIGVTKLHLESMDDVEELSCLESLDKSVFYQFEFVGLDNLKDLSVLRNFTGSYLAVPPQVEEQAAELVENYNFNSYEVRYPESGWNPLDENVVLLNLEELETLPKSVLRRVSYVWIVGDEIVDPNRYEVWDEWVNDRPRAVLYDRQTGETRQINPGSLTDFSRLSNLTGLRELRIFAQPIENLEGIQYFENLTMFEAKFCYELTDASALYTQQNLQEVSVQYTGIDTIQGVQNLPRLRHLNIFDTNVTDLSPLLDLDYKFAQECGGFTLIVGSIDADYSPLSVIPSFSHLNICGATPESWMPYVEQAKIYTFAAQMGSDEELKLFVQQHPEIREANIEEAYQLRDLTPLLDLEFLSYVHVWSGGEIAARSLEGMEYNFRFDVN